MPFQKGESGNPAGRPKGIPDRRQLLRDMLLPEAPKLVEAAIQRALNGDTALLKSCLDKLIPNCRQQTRVNVETTDGDSATQKGRNLVRGLYSGGLALEEGRMLMEILAIQAKLEEQEELAKRIDLLEQAHGID